MKAIDQIKVVNEFTWKVADKPFWAMSGLLDQTAIFLLGTKVGRTKRKVRLGNKCFERIENHLTE